jgi:hypothetical protein
MVEAYDLVRVANLTLGTLVLFICFLRLTRDWPRYSRRARLVRVHLCGYVFVITYGTAEAMSQHSPAGPRIIMLLAVHVSFLAALWRSRRDPVDVPPSRLP